MHTASAVRDYKTRKNGAPPRRAGPMCPASTVTATANACWVLVAPSSVTAFGRATFPPWGKAKNGRKKAQCYPVTGALRLFLLYYEKGSLYLLTD